MTSNIPDADAELAAVLRAVNESIMEFADQPATSASSVGLFGETPLHKVVTWGDEHAARVLLQAGANPNAKGEDDETPLHRAIGQKQHRIVKLLLETGALLDERDRYGKSARALLAESDDPGLRELLAGFARPR